MTAVASCLPWQAGQYDRLVGLHESGRLPHAIMLGGMQGTGIQDFARAFAGYLLCQNANVGTVCGHCHGCELMAAGSHPDLKWLAPEKAGGAIKVDQVREVVDFGHATAQQGGYRVIVLSPAEAMNINAANSLLKTLEEPGAKTLLMLLSYSPTRVLPTIRSRCQAISMPAPDVAQSKAWLSEHLEDPSALDILLQVSPRQPLYAQRLEASGGLPHLQALAASLPELVSGRVDPLAQAKLWQGADANDLLAWLYHWLSSAGLVLAGADSDDTVARQLAAAWPSGQEGLQQSLDRVVAARKQLTSGTNPNMQLLLESLALNLASSCA